MDMAVVVLILSFVFATLAVIGLFWPALVLRSKRFRAFFSYGILSIFLFFAAIVLISEPQERTPPASQSANTARVAPPQTVALPSFRIVEKTTAREKFGRNVDQAIFSVKTENLDEKSLKLIAEPLVEKEGGKYHSGAIIYFYKPAKTVGQEGPDHKVRWASGQGYAQDY